MISELFIIHLDTYFIIDIMNICIWYVLVLYHFTLHFVVVRTTAAEFKIQHKNTNNQSTTKNYLCNHKWPSHASLPHFQGRPHGGAPPTFIRFRQPPPLTPSSPHHESTKPIALCR